MKRYALFAWQDYYEGGGWNDLVGLYATYDEAESAAAQPYAHLKTCGERDRVLGERRQIIDLRSGEDVTSDDLKKWLEEERARSEAK